jgi:hypothetical protein
MPMRGELAIPATRPDVSPGSNHGAWAVVGFCSIGLLISIYCAVNSAPDQIPLLIVQSNLW